MLIVKCSVCETPIELPDKTKSGDRFTCTNCFAQLHLREINGEKVARCAVCLSGEEALECSEDCERKIGLKEARGFPFPE